MRPRERPVSTMLSKVLLLKGTLARTCLMLSMGRTASLWLRTVAELVCCASRSSAKSLGVADREHHQVHFGAFLERFAFANDDLDTIRFKQLAEKYLWPFTTSHRTTFLWMIRAGYPMTSDFSICRQQVRLHLSASVSDCS